MSDEARADTVIAQYDKWCVGGVPDRDELLALEIRAALRAVRDEERERVWGIVERYWTFDDGQQHTHSWHDKQDCFDAIEATAARGGVR